MKHITHGEWLIALAIGAALGVAAALLLHVACQIPAAIQYASEDRPDAIIDDQGDP